MNYLDTLQRAIVYIEEHLGENITVEEVAHATAYSCLLYTSPSPRDCS